MPIVQRKTFMTKKFSVLFVAFAIMNNCLELQAQSAQSVNITTTAVPFLRIAPDARAAGMGDLGIATLPDVNAVFWNRAKLNFAKQTSAAGLTYTPWLRRLQLNDVNYIGIAGYHQLDEEQVISSGIRYFNLGNIQFTDAAGNDLQQSRPREFSVDFGYSRKLNDQLSVGVALRYINSRLATGNVGGVNYKPGNAVAGDVSLFHNGLKANGEGITWGINLSNLGSKISYTTDAQSKDFIPANLGVGVAYTSIFDENNGITFGLDINKLLVPALPAFTGNNAQDSASLAEYRNYGVLESWFKSFSANSGGAKSLQVSIGAEYAYNNQFFIRAGYFYEDKNRGNRSSFTTGLGFIYNNLTLNFSYLIPTGSGVNLNPLSNTMRLGVNFDIDSKK